MLNPLFGNKIGITDQKHFHAAAPVSIPLTGLWHSSAHKPSIVPVIWYSSVIRQQTNSPLNGGFLVIFIVNHKMTHPYGALTRPHHEFSKT